MSKIAIYGGSFDPPHKGHVALANNLGDFCKAEKILIIPTAMSPFKNSSGANEGERLEMCRLAFSDPRFEVLDIEIKRGGKSYTVDTVKEVKKLYPECELFLLMGDDMLLSFNRWYKFEEILDMCTIVAACRTENLDKMQDMEQYISSELSNGNVLLCNSVPLEISSTEIRNNLKSDAKKYLSTDVYDYIVQKELYK